MMLRKLYAVIFPVLMFFMAGTAVHAADAKQILFFYGDGCPHCALVEQYFDTEHLYTRYPIISKEIYNNRDNTLLFNIEMDKLDVPQGERGVPAVILGERVLVGDRPIIDGFVAAADAYLAGSAKQRNAATPSSQPITPESGLNLTAAAVVGASAVDAINPCAFAVLIILMTTILASGGGRKALKSGFAFAASIFISYFLMGLGLYKALGVGILSVVFYRVVGWLAILLGLANLKDYFWYGKGFLMEVPIAWRPQLKKLIRSVTGPAGAFLVGFAVSLFLLPCTSGPYIVILGMLAKNTIETKALMYLLLYNLIFVSPMILITLAVYKGFDPRHAEAIRQRRLRTLHLIAGVIMLAMGGVIVAGWV